MVPPIQTNRRIYIQTLAFSLGVKVKHVDMGQLIQIWTYTSRCCTTTRSNEIEDSNKKVLKEKEELPEGF